MASEPNDPRHTYAWRRIRLAVLRDEPACRLRIDDGCTLTSTTADHIIDVIDRPDLALDRANLQGACTHCNSVKAGRTTQRRRLLPTPEPWVL